MGGPHSSVHVYQQGPSCVKLAIYVKSISICVHTDYILVLVYRLADTPRERTILCRTSKTACQRFAYTTSVFASPLRKKITVLSLLYSLKA